MASTAILKYIRTDKNGKVFFDIIKELNIINNKFENIEEINDKKIVYKKRKSFFNHFKKLFYENEIVLLKPSKFKINKIEKAIANDFYRIIVIHEPKISERIEIPYIEISDKSIERDVYINVFEDKIIGPYLLKCIDNKWEVFAKSNVLNEFNFVDISKSTYFYQLGEDIYFYPEDTIKKRNITFLEVKKLFEEQKTKISKFEEKIIQAENNLQESIALNNIETGVVKEKVTIPVNIDVNKEVNIEELFESVKNGDLNKITFLIEKGVNVNAKNNEGWPVLKFASENGNKEVVELLLNKGAEANPKLYYGWTILMFAAMNGHLEVAKLLIEKYADINAKLDDGWTALFFAIRSGKREMVSLLINHGANLKSTKKDGVTPFVFAQRNGRKEIVELLINHGANVNSGIKNFNIEFVLAIENGNIEVIESYIKNGVDLNAENIDGRTPLMLAVRSGQKEISELLINKKAKVNDTFKVGDGRNPLMMAVERGNYELVELLINYGAEVNSGNKYRKTPLMFAAKNGHLEVAKLLIKKSADVNSKTKNGITALMMASENGNYELVELLINNGADVNSKNLDNKTSLLYANQSGNKELVELLINHGAEINAKNSNERTSLMMASKRGNYELSKLLINHGADINSKTKNGMTALMIASENGNYELVELLINNGADVNSKNIDGKSALALASENDHVELAEFLKNREQQNAQYLELIDKKLISDGIEKIVPNTENHNEDEKSGLEIKQLLGEKNNQNEEIDLKIIRLDKQLQEIIENIEFKKLQIDKYDEQIKEEEKLLAKLTADEQKLDSQIKSKEQSINARHENILKLKENQNTQIKEFDEKIIQKNDSIKKLTSEENILNTVIKNKEQEVNYINIEIKKLIDHKKELEYKLSKLTNKVDKLETKITDPFFYPNLEPKIDIKSKKELFEYLKKHNYSLEKDQLENLLEQFNQGKLFYFEKNIEIVNIQNFFKAIGHSNGLFTINADASWVIPQSFWESSGFLKGTPYPIKVTELFDFANKNTEETIFQFIIQGANRSPVEGYFNQIINSQVTKLPFIYNGRIVKIPKNILFFLQKDNDDYSAKFSSNIMENFEKIKFPEITKFSKNVFVPVGLLVGEIEEETDEPD